MLSCALSCSNHPGMALALGAFNKKLKLKRKRCGGAVPAASSSTIATSASTARQAKERRSNTLRRQCMGRECANAEGLGLEDAEISPYTLDCLSQAIAHGKLVCGHTGSDEENDAIATPNKKARKDEGLLAGDDQRQAHVHKGRAWPADAHHLPEGRHVALLRIK